MISAERNMGGSQQTGGVGMVFYRDPGTPYLLVKEVIPDGPAFRSSLIYPGDRLVAINEFDLAWSGTTPRTQQPQLPGRHGSSVTLSFDRTGDSSPYPDRFNVTLIRDGSFYPDRLSSSPYRPFMDHEVSDIMKKSPEPSLAGSGMPRNTSMGVKKPFASPLPDLSMNRSNNSYQGGQWDLALTPGQHRPAGGSQQAFSTSGGSSVGAGGQRSANYIYDVRNGSHAGPLGKGTAPFRSATLPGKQQYGEKYGYGDRARPSWDPRSAAEERDGPNEDLDELIHEIARNDQILELQSKLNATEIEHDRRIKDLQRNQAGLEELVRNMRVELENSRDQVKALQQQLHRKLEESSLVESRLSAMKGHEEHIRDLQAQVAKERVQRQAAERRITVERESSVQKIQMYENELRAQIRSLESELEREREAREQAERGQAGMMAGDARHLQTERDQHEAQNTRLENEVRDLRNQLQEAHSRVARAIQQRDEHTYTQTHSYTRALEENKMLADQVRGLEGALSDVTRRMEELQQQPQQPGGHQHAPMENSSWEIPGLQAGGGTPGPHAAGTVGGVASDVELHQSPASAKVPSHSAPDSHNNVWQQQQQQQQPIYVSPHHSTQQMQQPDNRVLPQDVPAAPQREKSAHSQGSVAHMHGQGPTQQQMLQQQEAARQQEAQRQADIDRKQQEQQRVEQERHAEAQRQHQEEQQRQEEERQAQEDARSLAEDQVRQQQEEQQKLEEEDGARRVGEQGRVEEEQRQRQAAAAAQQVEKERQDETKRQEEERQRIAHEQAAQAQAQAQQPQIAEAQALVPPPQQIPANQPIQPAASVVKAGIGMSFQADPDSHLYIITEVHPSGPAGIAVNENIMVIGDALLAVNGVPVDGKGIPQIVGEILGPEHTPVQLSITRMQNGQPIGERIIVELVRVRPGTIPPNASGIARIVLDSEPKNVPDGQKAPAAAAPNLEEIELPPGWVQETDPSSGRVYYVNHQLKTFSWARPGQKAKAK